MKVKMKMNLNPISETMTLNVWKKREKENEIERFVVADTFVS